MQPPLWFDLGSLGTQVPLRTGSSRHWVARRSVARHSVAASLKCNTLPIVILVNNNKLQGAFLANTKKIVIPIQTWNFAQKDLVCCWKYYDKYEGHSILICKLEFTILVNTFRARKANSLT